MTYRHRFANVTASLGSIQIVVLLAACSSHGGDHSSPGAPTARVIVQDTVWQTGLRIGGEGDDSTIQIPLHPVANSSGLVVADLAAKRVLQFDHTGEVVWSFGRAGGGPNEFREPRDVRLDSGGRIWVLDPSNGRISVLTESGLLARQITIRDVGMAFEMVPLATGGALLTVPRPDSPFVEIDSTGAVVGRHSFPWARFQEMSVLATQFVTAADPLTGEWATAFRLGDSYFWFSDSQWVGRRHFFIEPVPFPLPTVSQDGNTRRTGFATRPEAAARSVTMSPNRLYVLFGGGTGNAKRLVDSYSRKTGAYIETYLLPAAAIDIEWYDGGLYVLCQNPYPEISYLALAGHPLP